MVLLVVGSGCSTVAPMQTASALPRGVVRVGGAITASGFCGDPRAGGLGVLLCSELPDGIPTPELRASGRLGLGGRADVGLSLRGQAFLFAPERAGELGGTLDVKGELLHVAAGRLTHIVSTGLIGSAAVSGRFGLPAFAQSEWGVPLLYGVQFDRLELVFSAALIRRRLARDFTVAAPFIVDSTHVQAGVSLFRKNGWAFGLGYATDTAKFALGSIQLQAGWFIDLGG